MSKGRDKLAYCLATWFYVGRAPLLPGTCGSLAAFPLIWLIKWAGGGTVSILAGAAIITAVGWLATRQVLKTAPSSDPGWVVVDEVAGQMIAACTGAWLAAFVLFRAFDMLKPWPVGWLDRKVKGATGVMADDVAAGAMALAVLIAARLLAN
ncbi:hypothetical protein FACS1894186_6390 [Alphaproteobacteria bacterium]|nr:hypothetical protein FACS1894186_6390 [Alphaproteobacteria bacterium]